MNTDQKLRKTILEELQKDNLVKNSLSSIAVSVQQGIAILSGLVDDYQAKIRTKNIATDVPGIKAVREQLEVKFPNSRLRVDMDWTSGKMAVS